VVAGAWAAIGVAALRASLVLADRSEARVRNLPFSGDAPSAIVDLETSPSARLRLDSHRADAYVLYAPRLTWRSVNFQSSTEVLHRATVGTLWRASRRTQWLMLEDAAYGVQDFSALFLSQPVVPGQPPPVDRVPVSQAIHFASSRADVLVNTQLSRRWRLSVLGEYLVSGGLETIDRTIYPMQRGARGEVSLERILGKRDGAITTLRVSRQDFDAGGIFPSSKNGIVDLLEAWRHRWTRTTETFLAVGVSETSLQLSTDASPNYDTHPLVEAQLVVRDPIDHLDLRAIARTISYIDRLRGTLDYQAQSTLTLTYAPWTVRSGFALRLQAGFAQSIPATKHDANRIVVGELGLLYRTSKNVLFEAGFRGAEQKIRDEPDVPFVWASFVAATFTTDPIRL
jgi:hypothetical protein